MERKLYFILKTAVISPWNICASWALRTFSDLGVRLGIATPFHVTSGQCLALFDGKFYWDNCRFTCSGRNNRENSCMLCPASPNGNIFGYLIFNHSSCQKLSFTKM